MATGRSDPVAGRDLHPQDRTAFARRTSKRAAIGNLIAIKALKGSFSRTGDSGAPVLSTDGKLLAMVVAGS
jgi:hypothetical protein